MPHNVAAGRSSAQKVPGGRRGSPPRGGTGTESAFWGRDDKNACSAALEKGCDGARAGSENKVVQTLTRMSPWHGWSRVQWQPILRPMSSGSAARRDSFCSRYDLNWAIAEARSLPASMGKGFAHLEGAWPGVPRPM